MKKRQIVKVASLCLTFFCILLISNSVSANHWGGVNAAAYARRYASDPNPAYPYFNGADCANFVSQAIHASGYRPMTSNWYLNSRSNYHTNWTLANGLRLHLARSGWGLLIYSHSLSNCPGRPSDTINGALKINMGDTVFYDFNNNGSSNHSAMVTRWQDHRDDISAHSNNRLNAIWHLWDHMSSVQRANTRYLVYSMNW